MSGSEPGRRRAGRPSTAVLTHERIVEAAFAQAEERGGEVSIAAIARRLGVQPPAIYNYFSSKAEVIAGMRGAIGRRIDSTVFSRMPWQDAVIPWAREYLDALGGNPGTIAAIATTPIDSEPESIEEYELIVNALRRDGYPEHRIVPALVALESFIIGSALDALTPEDNMSPARAPEQAPTLHRLEANSRQAAAAAGLPMSRAVFEFGLTALVAGLRALGAEEGDGGATP